MKKIIWLIFLFFICLESSCASGYYLDDLIIHSYELTPKYNKYNNLYSVNTKSGLPIEYIEYINNSDTEVSIKYIDNYILIELIKGKVPINTYKIIVNTEEEIEETFLLHEEKQSYYDYKYVITFGTIVVITIIGFLIFKKKNNKLFFH